MWKPCDSDFNLERHLIVFLMENPFYAEISRHMRKVATMDIPTAAVSYDPVEDELMLYWNPVFFGGGEYKTPKGETVKHEPMSNWEVRGVIEHELQHPVFGHLSSRRKTPPKMWNIATDLAINSGIVGHAGRRREDDRKDARPLPKCALIPGVRPYVDPAAIAAATPEQIAAMNELCDLIENFPKAQASEYYFNRLQEAAAKSKSKSKSKSGSDNGESMPGEGDLEDLLDSMDDHSAWDDVPDELREYVESKVKSIVEKAVNVADSRQNGWGNIPAELQAEIRRSISTIVDWRAVLRQFIGSLVRGERTTSIKRINRRYPYIHPGVKRGYTARLCIAIDQSGSVDDGQLNSFFGELASLTKRTSVDILPFDCAAHEKDIFEWRKGTTPVLKRVRCGGTDFNAPTRIINDPKNRGRWDGLLIMTDGECYAPEASRVKRGWVLSKGHKLMFDTQELQVFVDDVKQMTGAWR